MLLFFGNVFLFPFKPFAIHREIALCPVWHGFRSVWDSSRLLSAEIALDAGLIGVSAALKTRYEKQERIHEMRRKCLMGLLVSAIVFAGAMPAAAADATAGADIASAYVWRGITFNDGMVAQPYVDVAAGDFAINVWGNYDIADYNGRLEENEFSEIDLTLSYALPVETVDITIGHIEYLFPNGGQGTSEVFVSAYVSPLKNFSLGMDAYYDYGEVDDYYLAATLAYTLSLDSSLELGARATAGLAGNDFSPGSDSGLHEYTLAVNASYPVARNLDLTAVFAYTDSLDEDVLPDQDVDFYGAFGFSWYF